MSPVKPAWGNNESLPAPALWLSSCRLSGQIKFLLMFSEHLLCVLCCAQQNGDKM